ncbi:MAG: hypothetical protein KGJ43_02040 [Acidobacteriota bacterium]|nr:hypothetical protein [Acidobacteriota bacterium]
MAVAALPAQASTGARGALAAGGAATPSAEGAPAGDTGGSSVSQGAPKHRAPIVAHDPNMRYTGPVYELTAAGALVPYVPAGATALASDLTGGSSAATAAPGKPRLLVPGVTARLIGGLAAAPMNAPPAVREMIWAANRIIGLPYIYGGGHGSFRSPGYDCSGTVSFALHGASMLHSPEDSSELESYGHHGVGEWVTIFANPGHAYMDIAGLRLDTSPAEDPSGLEGPRWRPLRATTAGFVVRHPRGL